MTSQEALEKCKEKFPYHKKFIEYVESIVNNKIESTDDMKSNANGFINILISSKTLHSGMLDIIWAYRAALKYEEK